MTIETMNTARFICTEALQELGLIMQGRAPKSYDMNATFNSLKRLLESWSTSNLLVPSTTTTLFPMVAGQKDYTLGPTGDWVTERPMELQYAFVRFPQGTNQPVDYEMQIANDKQYASIPVKDVTTNIPTVLYYNATFPNASISIYPVPTANYDVVLWSTQPLDNFDTLDDNIYFPRGYARAIITNLALEIAPKYNKDPSPTLVAIATASLADIKRKNTTIRFLRAEGMYRQGRQLGNGPSPIIDMFQSST